MLNKKGQGVSMTYIVIAALALIVLIVIVLFFTGGMENMFKRITGTVEISSGNDAIKISQCEFYKSLNQMDVYKSKDCDEVLKNLPEERKVNSGASDKTNTGPNEGGNVPLVKGDVYTWT